MSASGSTVDLEAAMVKPKHIDHAELLQLGIRNFGDGISVTDGTIP
jgi:hypothetical protein